jgi:hypothetical protein
MSQKPNDLHWLPDSVAGSELSKYMDDDPSGKVMVDDLANRYGWTGGAVWRNADDVAARLTRPNGLAIDLVWNGDTLVRTVRGTRHGKIEAKGDALTGPTMLQIVAGWLEDTE